MFNKAFIATTLAGLAAAAPTLNTRSNAPVGLVAIHSGSAIQGSTIRENSLRFWIGKDTTTYCPSESVVACPNGTETTLYPPLSTGAGVSMNTEVPGGQQVYVLPNGEVGVTQAHSADTMGGQVDGFAFNPPTSGAGSVGEILFNSNDFSACPNDEAGMYQIYANGASNFTRTDCIGIVVGTAEYTGENVWQYI